MMKQDDFSKLLEQKLSNIVIQGRLMRDKKFISNLPYDSLYLASEVLSSIVTGFRIAFYHHDPVQLDLLGTFSPDGSFKPSSTLILNIEKRNLPQPPIDAVDWESIVNKVPLLQNEHLRDVLAKMISPIIEFTVKREQFLSLARRILTVWELTIYDFIVREKPIQISGIGKFSYDRVAKIQFTADPLLIRAVEAGNYRKIRNQALQAPESQSKAPPSGEGSSMETMGQTEWIEIIQQLQGLKQTIGNDAHDRFKRYLKILKDRLQSTSTY